MKKLFVILLVGLTVLSAVSATDTFPDYFPDSMSGRGLYRGTNLKFGSSYLVTDIGISFDFDGWEYGVDYYSIVPFVLTQMDKIGVSDRGSRLELTKIINKTLFLCEATAKYNFNQSGNGRNEFNFGPGIGWLGLSLERLVRDYNLDVSDEIRELNFGFVGLTTAFEYRHMFNYNVGFYVGTGLPVAGFMYDASGNAVSSSGLVTIFNRDIMPLILSYLAYTTRVGIIFSF